MYRSIVFFVALLLSPLHYVEASPQAISLAPIVTEAVKHLGAEQQLLAITKLCPPLSHQVPRVDAMQFLSSEYLITLKPDYVLTMHHTQLPPIAVKNGIRIYRFKNESRNDIHESIIQLGNLFGVSSKAEEIVDKLQNEITELEKLRTFSGSAAFLFHTGAHNSSFYGAGTHTFYAEILTWLGHTHVLTRNSGYFPISIEALLSLQPKHLYVTADQAHTNDVRTILLRYTKGLDIQIHMLPTQPTLFPGISYPEIYQLFLNSTISTYGH